MPKNKRYKVDKIFEDAKKLIVDNKLIFIDDIVAMLPITKPTFYSYFPLESEHLTALRELLDKNRIALKLSMRSKWYKSDAPALQMALMKLLSTPEELKMLAMNYQEVDHKNNGKSFEPEKTTIIFKKKT